MSVFFDSNLVLHSFKRDSKIKKKKSLINYFTFLVTWKNSFAKKIGFK